MQTSPLKARVTDDYFIKHIFIKISEKWCHKIVKNRVANSVSSQAWA